MDWWSYNKINKNGNFVLIDEIDLVLDSVLERMNSIFEADSVLVLSEKNINDNVEIIKPYQNYEIISTTCLKGNEAKKELSQIDLIKFFLMKFEQKFCCFNSFNKKNKKKITLKIFKTKFNKNKINI